MTTQAQPVGAGETSGDAADRSGSTAKLTLFAGVATALIAAIPATILALNTGGGGTSGAQTTPPTPVSSTVIAGSTAGEIDDVSVDGSDVYVMGSARPDVDSVVVMIPGRKTGGNYWYSTAKVQDQKWSVVIAADPDLPPTFKTIVRYREGQVALASLSFRLDLPSPSPSPAPPPGVSGDCVVQNGNACFAGPDWSQASVSEVQR
jgi:hypothetical protein